MLQEKGSSVWGGGVASMSFYERVQKGVLVGPSFTQGPKGWRVSSGSRGLKTSEREGETQRQKRRNRDGQRWVAGRQTAEDFL